MEVTWREEKRRLNLRKHGLDSALAQDVVSDPFAVTVFDRLENGEERWHTIGAILSGTSFKVVVVVHTYPEPGDENWIHVISLRTADPENGDVMKYYTSDGRTLTPGQIARLDEIETRVGESVDFPPAPEVNWTAAIRGKQYKAVQGAISICLDPDVQAWSRAKGLDRQTEINRILRERMLAEG